MASEKGDDWREFWGYGFHWGPDHQTAEQLRPMMFSYDTLATECLDILDKLPDKPSSVDQKGIGSKVPPETESKDSKGKEPWHRDLYELLKTHAHEDEKLSELWRQLNTVPDWVDWEQIDRGQRAFIRYAGPSIISLTFQSLLGGMASARVVETLTRTGGFGANVTRRRLLQTFQHILDVTKDLESVQPGGKGFASTVRVRMLHAAVRRRILSLAAQKPGYYDVEAWGVPANDLDSIGTVLTFSASLIWIGLPRQGIHMRAEETADYIALWRYIAYLLGVPTTVFANTHNARVFMESLLLSEIAPSPTGRILANNIVTGLADQPPVNASANFLRAHAHWLNGRALAEELAVARPPLQYMAAMGIQCLFFMAYCYGWRSVSFLDDANIRRTRALLHKVTMDQTGQKEAKHGFEWVPSLDLTATALGMVDGKTTTMSATGAEVRSVRALLMAGAAVGALVWVGAGYARASGLLQVM